MKPPMGCRLIGRWRIIESDLWDREHLDLCGPASLVVNIERYGEIEFAYRHRDEALLKAENADFFSSLLEIFVNFL